MKAFLLTSVIALLAGWWLHASLEQRIVNQPRPAASPARESGENIPPGMQSEASASAVPSRAEALVKLCATGGAKWEEQLLPLWIRWAEFAPEEALRHVEAAQTAIPDFNQAWAEDKILAAWASRDAGAAADWIRSRRVPTVSGLDGISGNGFEMEEAYPSAMETLALRDFTAAFSLIPHLFEKRALRERSSDYYQTWMPAFYAAALTETNLPVFLQSLRGLANGDIRGRMCADVISHLLQQQTPNRREIIAQLPLPDRWPRGVLSPWASLAYDEVKASPQPAVLADEYMAKLKPDDPGRSLVLEWIMTAWARRDPVAAGQWLEAWKDDPAVRNARRAYAREAAGVDAVAAYEWSADDREPRAQATVAQRAYLQLNRKNAAAAAEWLKHQNLPPALVSRLLGEGKVSQDDLR